MIDFSGVALTTTIHIELLVYYYYKQETATAAAPPQK